MNTRNGRKAAGQRRKRPDARRAGAGQGDTVWLFGLHAVRDALANPKRKKLRLIVTRNACDRLDLRPDAHPFPVEVADARKFPAPLDPQSVHQGAALEVAPLDWGSVSEVCRPGEEAPLVLLLDRVTDPHNIGAILRSAEVFGARAVIAPHRHSAPETGALAKAASGALERQPYLRVPNLARAMNALREMGYTIIGLDGEAAADLANSGIDGPVALALGAEGPGLRQLTRETCHQLARILAAGAFGSLNVSNAAAVAMFAVAQSRKAGPNA